MISRVKWLGLVISVAVLAACTQAGGTGAPSPAEETHEEEGPAVTVAPVPSSFELSGRMVWVDYEQGVVEYDPVVGQMTPIFTPQSGGIITAAALSPDGSQIAIAYAPPVTEGMFYGNSGIYLVDMGGTGKPEPVIEPGAPEELFVNPFWSPDGKALYYGHSSGSVANNNYDFWLERRDLASGDVTRMVEYAFFPQMSPNGERVLYLKVDLKTYDYDLYMANVNGGNIQAVIPHGVFFTVDAPIWSPDGKAVIFSAVGEPTTGEVSPQRDWFADWFGVGTAKAHSGPSDLWRMDLATGKFERLTSVSEIGINPAFSPDGKVLAFLASAGLWIMDTRSGAPVLIAKTYAFSPLQWVP